MKVQEIVARYLPAVEAEMRAVLTVADSAITDDGRLPFYGMMHYQIGWVDDRFQPVVPRTGKGIRPVLCLLTSQALGGPWERALPAAAAIELTHNFSLIHDDVEDGDEVRRGRPTVWCAFGQPQAINTGDGLFVVARLTLHRLVDRGIPRSTVQQAIEVFDRACLHLCQGQYLDLSFEDRLDVTVSEYLDMVRGKTAALLMAAVHLGAMLASDDQALIAGYRRFAEHLGLAFQIRDDMLGIWGDPAVTGKSAASDILRRKKSLPVVYALRQDRSGRMAELYRGGDLRPEDVSGVLDILEEVGARDYARQLAGEHRDRALAELAATGIDNGAQARLRIIAQFLTDRQR